MKKFLFFCSLIPMGFCCKALDGSLSKLLEMALYGNTLFWKELYLPSLESGVIALLFVLFVQYIAPKVSLLIGSSLALLAAYLFLPTPFFYDHLGSCLLALALIPTKKRNSQTLFFSLFYLTLLHTLSCLLISFFYYGKNEPILLQTLPVAFALILLMAKKVYPSPSTLLVLFPLLLFPCSYQVHHSSSLSAYQMLLTISSILAIYSLLQKQRGLVLLLSLCFCILCVWMAKEAYLPFVFVGVALSVQLVRYHVVNTNRVHSERLL